MELGRDILFELCTGDLEAVPTQIFRERRDDAGWIDCGILKRSCQVEQIPTRLTLIQRPQLPFDFDGSLACPSPRQRLDGLSEGPGRGGLAPDASREVRAACGLQVGRETHINTVTYNNIKGFERVRA